MLSTPEHGWTEIQIGPFTGWGGFIQDVPVLFLEAFIRALSCDLPAEVQIDEEGSAFTVRAHHDTQITAFRDAVETFRCGADVRALAKELLRDLRRDWDLWLTWPLANHPDRLTKAERRDFLDRRAAHLTRLTQSLAHALQAEEIP